MRKVFILVVCAFFLVGLLGTASVQSGGSGARTEQTRSGNEPGVLSKSNIEIEQSPRRAHTIQQSPESVDAEAKNSEPGREIDFKKLPALPLDLGARDRKGVIGIALSDIDPKILQDLKRHASCPDIQGTSTLVSTHSAMEDAAEQRLNQSEASKGGHLWPLAPGLLLNFAGLSNADQSTQWTPPNPNIAAGPNHIMVVVNSQFAVYSKSGSLLSKTTFPTWFAGVCSGCSAAGYFDPRLTYDPNAGRWIMVELYRDTTSQSKILVSISQSSDPTGSWWNYALDGVLNYAGENTWADYPDVGFDGIVAGSGGAIYVTANQFTFNGGSFRTSILYILPKASLYAGAAINYWRAWDRKNSDNTEAFTLRASKTYGNPGGEYLINSENNGSTVSVWRVNPTYPPTAVDWVLQSTINIGSYSVAPSATQPGTSDLIDTADNRLQNSVWQNNRIYSAFTEAHNWYSGTVASLRYLKINTVSNAAEINETFGSDGLHYFCPAIATDSSDNIFLLFSRSSSAEYAGAYYTGRLASNALTQASVPLKAGTAPLIKRIGQAKSRWGDYQGAAIDPSDGTKVWVSAEWAVDLPGISNDFDWSTWIGQIKVPAQRVLTVTSKNPSSGVPIQVSPKDNYGLGDDEIFDPGFTRTYNDGTLISLTAPAAVGDHTFQKWQRDGADFATTLTVNLTMDVNHTMCAVYVTPLRTLTIASTNPNSGVGVTVIPNDNNGLGNGSTQATRTYDSRTQVYLTAAATASGNFFQKWQLDGVDYATTPWIDLVMDTNHILTAVYVSSSQSCISAPSGIVAWFRSGGDVKKGNDTALLNGATYATGKVGSAFSLDGVNDFAEASSWSDASPTVQITIEAWINPSAIAGASSRRIVDKSTAGSPDGFNLDIFNGKLRLVVGNNPPGGLIAGATNVPLNTWTHVAGTYDGANIRLYINGTLDGTIPATGPIPWNNRSLRIGADSNGANVFKGLIDEVTVYDRALTAAEIHAIFNSGSLGKCSPIVSGGVEAISGPSGQVTGNYGDVPIYFLWQAPQNGVVSFDTTGSNFDTTLGVYLGRPVSGLGGNLGTNDDNSKGGRLTSAVSFNAVAGNFYTVLVGGYDEQFGNVILNWHYGDDLTPIAAPPNDSFANAQVINGFYGNISGTASNATREVLEPPHDGRIGGTSIWYRWRAPASGIVFLNTSGSQCDTVLAVYTGSSLASLTRVASNDDASSSVYTSSVSFNATAGIDYQIAIDVFRGLVGAGDLGKILLNWSVGGRIGGSTGRSGTVLTLSGSAVRETVSARNGRFTFPGLQLGGNFTIPPPSSYLPPAQSYNSLAGIVSDADFAPIRISATTGTVSGKVVNTAGVGVEGVTVNAGVALLDAYSDRGRAERYNRTGSVPTTFQGNSAITNSGGAYIISNLPVGVHYVIGPSTTSAHFLYTFAQSPTDIPNLSGDHLGADFTVTSQQPLFDIGGQVKNADGTPRPGVTVILAGAQKDPVSTDPQGLYLFQGLLGGGTYSVAPTPPAAYTPPPIPFPNLSANQKTADFTVAATITISGHLRNVNGRGLSGEKVNLTGSDTQSKTTDADGAYSFTVTSGGTYDVAPNDSRVGTWSPSNSIHHANLTQNVSTDDFEARFPSFTVAGVIKNGSGTNLSGVTVRLTGTLISNGQKQVNATYTTKPDGSYTSDQLNILGDYTFAPDTPFIAAGTTYGSFNPTNRAYNVPCFLVPTATCDNNSSTNNYLGADFTAIAAPTPVVTVGVSPLSVNEDGATNLVYTFSRTDATSALTVNFSVGGTATFNSDYAQSGATTFTSTTGTVSFAAGETSKAVTVDPTSDNTVEANETVVLTVTAGTGYIVGASAVATGTINNDDTDVTVAVSPSTVTEDGATNLVYTFTRTGATNASTVNFSVGGTATFNSDYTQSGATTFTATTGTIAFAGGETSKTVTVDPTSDTTVEANETVVLTVTAGTGYNVGASAVATGTINNDDTDVTVAVSPSSVNEDGVANLVYTFTRSGVTTGAITVNFTVGGTATFNTDYTQSGATTFTSTSGTIAFASGETTKTVTVDPTIDTTVEPDETVALTVTSGSGYNAGSPNSTTGTITNDDTDVTVAVSPASVNEDGASNLVYTFTRNGVTSGAITVNFSVSGTATFNTDYIQSGATTFTSTTGTIAFASGETTKTVTVDPTIDTTVEPNETVILTVTSGGGYSVGTPSSATGTITNDDATPAVQFSQSAYNVTEGVQHVDVMVNRVGDTSGAASVSFFTSDNASSQSCSVKNGAASSRCDYEARFATLKFAAGETSKTISILIEDDAYLEGPETFSVNLANPSGASLGAISTATVTINDNDLTNGANPIDGVNFFVTMQYLDFLNREPDAPGFAFWTGNINNCTPQPSCTESARVSTSGAFYLSIEFQQTGYLVERVYKAAYGDATGSSFIDGTHSLPVPIVRLNEFLEDTQQIGRGVVVGQTGWETALENNKQAFMVDFVQSPRFTSVYPTTLTPAQFVDALNANAGNVLSSSERTTLINLFGSAGDTANATARAQALRLVAEDQELQQAEFSRAFVLMQYFGYLRRNPNDPQDTDYSGYEFWLNKMNNFGGDYLKAEMVKAFLNSNEYRQRFGPN